MDSIITLTTDWTDNLTLKSYVLLRRVFVWTSFGRPLQLQPKQAKIPIALFLNQLQFDDTKSVAQYEGLEPRGSQVRQHMYALSIVLSGCLLYADVIRR